MLNYQRVSIPGTRSLMLLFHFKGGFSKKCEKWPVAMFQSDLQDFSCLPRSQTWTHWNRTPPFFGGRNLGFLRLFLTNQRQMNRDLWCNQGPTHPSWYFRSNETERLTCARIIPGMGMGMCLQFGRLSGGNHEHGMIMGIYGVILIHPHIASWMLFWSDCKIKLAPAPKTCSLKKFWCDVTIGLASSSAITDSFMISLALLDSRGYQIRWIVARKWPWIAV